MYNLCVPDFDKCKLGNRDILRQTSIQVDLQPHKPDEKWITANYSTRDQPCMPVFDRVIRIDYMSIWQHVASIISQHGTALAGMDRQRSG